MGALVSSGVCPYVDAPTSVLSPRTMIVRVRRCGLRPGKALENPVASVPKVARAPLKEGEKGRDKVEGVTHVPMIPSRLKRSGT